MAADLSDEDIRRAANMCWIETDCGIETVSLTPVTFARAVRRAIAADRALNAPSGAQAAAPQAGGVAERLARSLEAALEVGSHLMNARDYAEAKAALAGASPAALASRPAADAAIPTQANAARQAMSLGPWTLMEDSAPPADSTCAVMVRYSADRPPFMTTDKWEMQREDPIGMGGPTIETGYGWSDNYESDVIAWIVLPPMLPEHFDPRYEAMQGASNASGGKL